MKSALYTALHIQNNIQPSCRKVSKSLPRDSSAASPPASQSLPPAALPLSLSLFPVSPSASAHLSLDTRVGGDYQLRQRSISQPPEPSRGLHHTHIHTAELGCNLSLDRTTDKWHLWGRSKVRLWFCPSSSFKPLSSYQSLTRLYTIYTYNGSCAVRDAGGFELAGKLPVVGAPQHTSAKGFSTTPPTPLPTLWWCSRERERESCCEVAWLRASSSCAFRHIPYRSYMRRPTVRGLFDWWCVIYAEHAESVF